MELISSDNWNDIFGFVTYEDKVLSGETKLANLLPTLKRQYKINTLDDYINMKINEGTIFYLPLKFVRVASDRFDNCDISRYLYLTEEIIKKYKRFLIRDCLFKNPTFPHDMIDEIEEKEVRRGKQSHKWEDLSQYLILDNNVLMKYKNNWVPWFLILNPTFTKTMYYEFSKNGKFGWSSISQQLTQLVRYGQIILTEEMLRKWKNFLEWKWFKGVIDPTLFKKYSQ